MKIDPKTLDLYSEGIEAYQTGKFDQAITLFEQVLQDEPEFFRALVYRAMTHVSKKDLAAAEKDLKAALRISPDYHKAWNELGNVFRKKGELDRAIQAYDEASRRDLKNPNYLYNLHLTQIDLQRNEEAFDTLRRAHEVAPDDEEVLYELGSMALQLARPVDAAGYYEELLRRHPDSKRAPELMVKVRMLKQTGQNMETQQYPSVGGGFDM